MKRTLLLTYLALQSLSISAQDDSLKLWVSKYPLVFTGHIADVVEWPIHDLGTYPVQITLQVDSIYQTSWIIPQELKVTVDFVTRDLEALQPKSLTSYFAPFTNTKVAFFFPDVIMDGEAVYVKAFRMISMEDITDSLLYETTSPNRIDLSEIPFYPKDSTRTKLCDCVAQEDWKGTEQVIKRYLRKFRKGEGHDMRWFEEKPCVAYVYKHEICLSSLPSWCGFGVAFHTPSGIRQKYLSMKYGKINQFLWFSLGSRVDYQKFLGMSDDPDGWKNRAETTRANWLNTVSAFSIEDTATGVFIPDISYFHHAHLEGSRYHYLNHSHFQDRWLGQIKELETQGYVYSLCLLSLHSDASVQMAALESLSRLDDPRAIPYLIDLAEYQASLYLPPARDEPSHQAYCIELIRTLNSLSNLQLPAETGYTNTTNYGQRLIKTGLPSWRSRITNAKIELPNSP